MSIDYQSPWMNTELKLLREMVRNFLAVSYTHLDVYKRQVPRRRRAGTSSVVEHDQPSMTLSLINT